MTTDYGDSIFAGFASQHIEFTTVYNDDNLTAPEKREALDAMIEAAVTKWCFAGYILLHAHRRACG
jgi:hypothetical protein